MLSVRGIPNILGGCNKSLHGDTIDIEYSVTLVLMFLSLLYIACLCHPCLDSLQTL